MSANATIPQSRAPDDDPGLGLAIEFGLLHSIALILYSLRMYSRIRPKMLLWWDDLFLTLAVCFSLVSLSFACASLKWGLGRHNYYLDPESTMYATKYLWLSEWPYAWGLVFGKIAITVTLLRILHQSIWWRWVLCSMCVLQVLIAVCMNAFFFSQCTPLAMNWDPSATGTCKPLYVAQISIYVNAALTITTDFILSLIPITFLRKLQRPLRERIAIGCLMGLGLIASCASIYKTTLATSYGNTGDALRDSVGLTVWSILEMELGIIAACAPALKSMFENGLRKVGLLSSSGSSGGLSGYFYSANARPADKKHANISLHSVDKIPSDGSGNLDPFGKTQRTHPNGNSEESILPVMKPHGLV